MYAVELRKPAWLKDIVLSADACFHFDAKGGKKNAVLKQSYPEAFLNMEFGLKVTGAAAQKMVEWINLEIGASNPPTALFRSGIVSCLPTSGWQGRCPYTTCLLCHGRYMSPILPAQQHSAPAHSQD